MKLSARSVIGLLIHTHIFILQLGVEGQQYCSRQNFISNDRAKLKRCEAKLDNFKRVKTELLNLLDDKNKMNIKLKKLEKVLKNYKSNNEAMMDQIVCLNIGKTESETQLRRLMQQCSEISTTVPLQATKVPNWTRERPVIFPDYDDEQTTQQYVTTSRPVGAVQNSNLLGGKTKTIYYVNASDPTNKKEIVINYRPFSPNLRAPVESESKDGVVRTGSILTQLKDQETGPTPQNNDIHTQSNPSIASFKRSMLHEMNLCENELSDVTIRLENCTLDKNEQTEVLNECVEEHAQSNKLVKNLLVTVEKCESEVRDLNSTLLDCHTNLFAKKIEAITQSGAAKKTQDHLDDVSSRLAKCLQDKTQCERDLNQVNKTLSSCHESLFNLTTQITGVQRELNDSKTEKQNLTNRISSLEDDVTNFNNSLQLRVSLLDKIEADCKKNVGPCSSGLKKLRNGGVYYLHTDTATKKSWQEARDFCISCGMELVHIDDQEEHDVIAKFIISTFRSSSPPVWIGLSRDHSDLVARLSSQEKCMELVRSGENSTLGWDDKDCSVKQHYVCEMPSPCNLLFSHSSNRTDNTTETTTEDSSCYVGHIMVKHSNSCAKTKMTVS